MQPEAVGRSDQIGQRSGVHFPHDIAEMNLHGDLAQSQLGSDLLVHQSRCHKAHHLPLSRSKRLKCVSQRLARVFAFSSLAVAIDRHRGSVEDCAAVHRLYPLSRPGLGLIADLVDAIASIVT